MQGVLAESTVPVWVRGGIGPHVAAGCIAAGAAGVVLDGAILARARIAARCRSGASGSRGGTAPRQRSSRRPRERECGCTLGRARPRSCGCGRPPRKEVRRGRPPSECRGRLAGRPVCAGRSGRGAGGRAGAQLRDGRRDRPGRRAGDPGRDRGGASGASAGRGGAAGRRLWHALSDPPGADDAGQRRRRVCPGGGARRRAAVSGSGALRGPEVQGALARGRKPARRPAVGRGHSRLRAAGAACRAARRGAARPGRPLP